MRVRRPCCLAVSRRRRLTSATRYRSYSESLADRERIRQVLDAGPRVTDRDCHDVESARDTGCLAPDQIVECLQREPALLGSGDRRKWTTESFVGPGLDLDEHQHVAVPDHDVDFAVARAVAARKNYIPSAPELAAGEVFAEFP